MRHGNGPAPHLDPPPDGIVPRQHGRSETRSRARRVRKTDTPADLPHSPGSGQAAPVFRIHGETAQSPYCPAPQRQILSFRPPPVPRPSPSTCGSHSTTGTLRRSSARPPPSTADHTGRWNSANVPRLEPALPLFHAPLMMMPPVHPLSTSARPDLNGHPRPPARPAPRAPAEPAPTDAPPPADAAIASSRNTRSEKLFASQSPFLGPVCEPAPNMAPPHYRPKAQPERRNATDCNDSLPRRPPRSPYDSFSWTQPPHILVVDDEREIGDRFAPLPRGSTASRWPATAREARRAGASGHPSTSSSST